MIKILVEENTPLTHPKFATECVVVISAEDQKPAGVFPSVERAFQYIKEWISSVADVSQIKLTNNPEDDHAIVRLNGRAIYIIDKTNFRV